MENASSNERYRESVHQRLIWRHPYAEFNRFSYRDRVATRYIQWLDYQGWGYR